MVKKVLTVLRSSQNHSPFLCYPIYPSPITTTVTELGLV